MYQSTNRGCKSNWPQVKQMNSEYQAALKTMRQAEQNFQYADEDEFKEIAILELNAAQKHIDAMVREMKGGGD